MRTRSRWAPPRPDWRYPLLFGLATMLISCSPAKPDCSAPEVIATVKELVTQALGENTNTTFVYDLKASKLDLQAIRTTSSDERHSDCRANLKIDFELNSELKAQLATKPANSSEGQLMQSLFGERSRSVDLQYKVERTDDGKGMYVSIERF